MNENKEALSEAEQNRRIAEAARKVIESLDAGARLFRLPYDVALALVKLEREIKGPGNVELERRFADTLARRCDELEAENKLLKQQLAARGK
jgi:hypothetical protein